MRLSFSVNLALSSLEAGWAAAAFPTRPGLEAASRDYLCPEWDGAAFTVPWDVLFRVEDDFAPGELSREFPFWRNVLLIDHLDRANMLTWLRGVSVYELLLPDARRVAIEQRFYPAVLSGEEILNRVLEEFRAFVAGEVATLVRRGCLVPRCLRATAHLGRASSCH